MNLLKKAGVSTLALVFSALIGISTAQAQVGYDAPGYDGSGINPAVGGADVYYEPGYEGSGINPFGQSLITPRPLYDVNWRPPVRVCKKRPVIVVTTPVVYPRPRPRPRPVYVPVRPRPRPGCHRGRRR